MLSSVSDTLIHEGVAAGDDPSGAGDQHGISPIDRALRGSTAPFRG